LKAAIKLLYYDHPDEHGHQAFPARLDILVIAPWARHSLPRSIAASVPIAAVVMGIRKNLQ
jgi:hypothetical protein